MPLTKPVHPLRAVGSISDQEVAEDWLSEDFRLRSGFSLHKAYPHVHPGFEDVFPE